MTKSNALVKASAVARWGRPGPIGGSGFRTIAPVRPDRRRQKKVKSPNLMNYFNLRDILSVIFKMAQYLVSFSVDIGFQNLVFFNSPRTSKQFQRHDRGWVSSIYHPHFNMQ